MIKLFLDQDKSVLYIPFSGSVENEKYEQFSDFLYKISQGFFSKILAEISPDEYKGLKFSPTQTNLKKWVLETADLLGLQVKIIDLPTIEEGNEEIQTAIEALRPFAGAQVVHDCISYLMSQNLRPVCYKAMCKFPTQKLYAVKMVMAEAQISLKAAKDAIDEIWNG
jgi:hypothetical protein